MRREADEAGGTPASQEGIVYYGEATQSFWAVTPAGLLEAANADALLLALWPHNAPFMPPALAVEALTPVTA